MRVNKKGELHASEGALRVSRSSETGMEVSPDRYFVFILLFCLSSALYIIEHSELFDFVHVEFPVSPSFSWTSSYLFSSVVAENSNQLEQKELDGRF